MGKNARSATYMAASNAIWNPINNAVWNPINTKKIQEKIAEENRIRLAEMFENGDITDLPRCHEDLRILVDDIFSEFDSILLFMTVYVGYTGVSLALEPFRLNFFEEEQELLKREDY